VSINDPDQKSKIIFVKNLQEDIAKKRERNPQALLPLLTHITLICNPPVKDRTLPGNQRQAMP
jgi:hypothetical protein